MKFNLKSLALCAAMLSFGFADNNNNIDVFGGELEGDIIPDNDTNGPTGYFGSRYETNEFEEKASKCTFPVSLGITITGIGRDCNLKGPYIRDYNADVDLFGSRGQIYLSGINNDVISISFKNIDLNDNISHTLMVEIDIYSKYLVYIANDQRVQESEQTLADALTHINLNLPLLCKGLLKLRDNWTEFKNRAENVGSTFTL